MMISTWFWLWVVIGEPLLGIGRASWAPQQVAWPVGALEPGVVVEQVRVVGVGKDDDARGVLARGQRRAALMGREPGELADLLVTR